MLFMALDQLYATRNPAEIRYWYTEWEPTAYQDVQHMSFEEVWGRLFEEAQRGWSEKHEQLCARLVKGQPFFFEKAMGNGKKEPKVN
ncbi:hypothetical protein GCM10020331_078740 [Ectobacillus funiculus]